ncbi:hypothetical protein [Halostagnicola sp. A56]|uniref:hypothetical protein n=1 Tax=Halostagnicola sp. A56 TaxID=1495067 RepID=UPI0012E28A41|nr:hypothetical protein [Halostagnicola sp. A56]
MAILLTLAFVLSITNYELFKKYANIFLYPILFIAHFVTKEIYVAISGTPKVVIVLSKVVLAAILSLVFLLAFAFSFFVPFIGEKASSWRASLKRGLVASYIIVQVRKMRGILVSIVAEEDDRDRDFEDIERYRLELTQVKQDGKNRLEMGETLLSLLLGAVLLLSNLVGFELLQTSISGIQVDFLVQGWLFLISISIMYRSSLLELLSYRSNEDFDSLNEIDAALGYQKAISLVGFIQGLMFLVVFIASITKLKHRFIEKVLRMKYNNGPWVSYAWNKINNNL